jgi:2-aminoadipate transaminase
MNVQFAGRMGRDGMACTAEDVLIPQGAQQGLDLAAKLLVDRSDIIITKNPTFLGALIAFNPTSRAVQRCTSTSRASRLKSSC